MGDKWIYNNVDGQRYCNYYHRWHLHIDGKWINRSKAVWEHFNGPVPKGSIIHHINHDQHDDRIENLQLMTRAEHARHHAIERDRLVPRAGYNGRA